MKKILILISIIGCSVLAFGQDSGNINQILHNEHNEHNEHNQHY